MNGNEKEIKLPKLICMADVEEKEAEWLTPNYLARACINMMAGDGGSGKTTTWCGIATGVSAGTRVFFEFLIGVHTNKQQGVFRRNRVADSADIWDISRSVLIIGQTQDGKRYLSHEKSNYGEPGATAIFDIVDSVAVFEEYSDKKDKDFVGERDFETRQAPQRADAERFIYDFLKAGKKPTAELDEAAKAAGISKNTLNRAKTELRKRGLLGGKSEGFGNNKAFYSYLIEKTF